MATVRVDMSAAEETIPNGPYLLAVTDYKIKDSKSSPYQYIQYTYAVQEGENAGFKIRDRVSLSPAAAFRVKQFLGDGLGLPAEIGVPGSFMEKGADGKPVAVFDPADHLGMRFGAILSSKTDEYGTGMNVDKYMTEDEFRNPKSKDGAGETAATAGDASPSSSARRRK